MNVRRRASRTDANRRISFTETSAWLTAAPVVLALTFGWANPARADLVATRTAPTFSSADKAIIARNTALSAILSSNPWLVRQALDEIEAEPDAPSKRKLQPLTRDAPIAPAFDAKKDPDLDRLQRSSPEAAHDLFQLLKKASDEKAR